MEIVGAEKYFRSSRMIKKIVQYDFQPTLKRRKIGEILGL